MQMNFVSFIIAGLIPMIMGFIYYHPSVMGNAWMKANGLTKDSIGNGPKPMMYLVSTLFSFLLAFFFFGWTTAAGAHEGAQFADVAGKSHVTFGHGAFHGIAFTIMVLLPLFGTGAIFEKRSWTWVWINVAYWGICAILMNGVLSAWR